MLPTVKTLITNVIPDRQTHTDQKDITHDWSIMKTNHCQIRFHKIAN